MGKAKAWKLDQTEELKLHDSITAEVMSDLASWNWPGVRNYEAIEGDIIVKAYREGDVDEEG